MRKLIIALITFILLGSTCYASTETARYGDRGDNVVQAQEIMNGLNYWQPLQVDGIYGRLTEQRCAEIQCYLNQQGYNLAIDGVFGANTSYAILDYLNAKIENKRDITEHLVVDKSDFRVYHLVNGIIVKSMKCSIGAPNYSDWKDYDITETPTGTFSTGSTFDYYKSSKSIMFNCTSIVGTDKLEAPYSYKSYLFHSIIYKRDDSVTNNIPENFLISDGRLEQKVSAGCIRLLPEDAGYIKDLASNTSLVVKIRD